MTSLLRKAKPIRRVLQNWLCLLFLLLLVTQSALSQELPTAIPEEVGLSSERLERINKVMEKHVEQGDIAGVVTLVTRRGKVAHFEAFGMMDMENDKPMRTDTIFRIASMTKSITSVAVMMLYEEGHFLLSDPVSKYIPEFNNPKVLAPESDEASDPTSLATVPAKGEIKIRHLLNHTSGITYQWNRKLGKTYNEAGVTNGIVQTDSTIGEKMRVLAGLPLLHHPGEAYEYGLSVDVLGYLVEVVSGMTLDQFFHKRIFKPLGMRDTHFFIPEEKLPRLAAVYKRVSAGDLKRLPEEPVTEGTNTYSISYPYQGPQSYFSGGGGLSSTTSDYAQFLRMLLNGGELNGVRLLSPKTVELMTTNSIGELATGMDFGLGFGIRTERGLHGELASNGTYSWGGFFYTGFGVDPEEEMIYIFMSQLHPTGGLTLGSKFEVLVYQAIVD
ncbi:serine hydrolase domain-containing protein [Candidatus Poribacteria bacterium]